MHGRRLDALGPQIAGDLVHVALGVREDDRLQGLALLGDLLQKSTEPLELLPVVHLLEVLLHVGGRMPHLAP